jgi:hypothetical protein
VSERVDFDPMERSVDNKFFRLVEFNVGVEEKFFSDFKIFLSV